MSHLTKFLFSLVLAATFISPVLAHGIMTKLVIDGKTFAGPAPAENDQKSADSIIRRVADTEPVTSVDDAILNCGRDATKAALVADVQPGSSIQAFWGSSEGGNWPHEDGPMMTYLAKCDGDCAQFDPSSAKFFKITEAGKDNTGRWTQADLKEGKPHSFNLPNNLAAGGYIMRHEIISLQNAISEGGAEFYPACAQINVGGNESGQPKTDELVNFPGAYKSTDPGILVPDLFNDPQLDYQFPGPEVASFIAGASGSASSPSTIASGTASSSKRPGVPRRNAMLLPAHKARKDWQVRTARSLN
ncbi:glycoside hydrolase family 61 protein [Flagelloscypha sp. PMI_526]|nr:glycoside hydrolase family 61 protein [Flagelloscypha sp. PMI_526]